MKTIRLPALAVLLLLPALASAGKKDSTAAAAPDGSALIDELKTSGVDKRRFEAYVKRRIGKINERHKNRIDFMAKESDVWMSFWTKVRDERKLFEIRMTRQTHDLFESLASLDSADHNSAIADFQKMQGNVIKSFEDKQNQKLEEFFGARDKRWREFVTQEVKDRQDFLSSAPNDWQHTRGAGAAAAASEMADETAASSAEAEDTQEPADKPVKKGKH